MRFRPIRRMLLRIRLLQDREMRRQRRELTQKIAALRKQVAMLKKECSEAATTSEVLSEQLTREVEYSRRLSGDNEDLQKTVDSRDHTIEVQSAEIELLASVIERNRQLYMTETALLAGVKQRVLEAGPLSGLFGSED